MGDDEGLCLQQAACRYFLKAYNEYLRTHFEILTPREGPYFTVHDRNTGKTIGVAVTHLSDSADTEMALGSRTNAFDEGMSVMEWMDRLNEILAQKATAIAQSDFHGRLILLIIVPASILVRKDGDIFTDNIAVPALETVDEMWLLGYDPSTSAFTDMLPVRES